MHQQTSAEEAPLVVEAPVVFVLVELETLLAGALALLLACTRAKTPTRSASVTASTMMRGSALRRGERGVERDAICGVCRASPAESSGLPGAGRNVWAIVVSFPH